MTKAKIEPDRILTNFLRTNLSDPNSSRSGNWIYPDFPRVQSLGDSQFPRIGITILSEPATMLGIFDDNQRHLITFQIDCVAKKDHTVTLTVTDEAMGTISSTINSNRITYDFIPSSVTNIKHAGTSYGTVTNKNTVDDFTSPAGLSAGIVEYSFSTGDLNFSSADVSSHDGEAITSSYTVKMEGKKLVQYLARQIIKKIRTNWRTSADLNGMYYPVFLGNTPIPIDEDLGIYRQMLELSFVMYNVGEGI